MKDCIVGTFNAKNVAVSGDIKLLLPSAFSGEEMQVTSEARLFNLSLADLGALYKGTPEMENTGIIEMNTYLTNKNLNCLKETKKYWCIAIR